MKPLVIRAKFRDLIPSLAPEELEQLEANLKADGCRDPLVVWPDGGELVIIDGNNRHEICTRNGIPFNTVEHDFDDEDAAADWIDQNQLGRRNLTPKQMATLRGRRYNRVKRAVGRPAGEQGDEKCGKTCHNTRTAESLAKEHGVSERTIRNDGELYAATEKLGIVKEFMDGEIKAPRAEVIHLADILPEKPTEVELEEAREVLNSPAMKEAKKKAYGNALRFARSVVAKLKTIPSDDPDRVEALKMVKQYVSKELGK